MISRLICWARGHNFSPLFHVRVSNFWGVRCLRCKRLFPHAVACEVCGAPATHVVDSDLRYHVCGPHVGTVGPR